MISRRITVSALFILILVASLFAGLTSCSDVLLQKESTDFALSFVAPGASTGRASDGAAHWNITAWLELEDGTTLQSQQTTAMAGEPVSIAFAPVAAGTRLKVKVELVSAQPPLQKYAGESDSLMIAEGDNVVNLPVERAPLTAAVPQITKQPQSYSEPASDDGSALETTLSVEAFSPDGGDLSYRWFSSDDPAIDGGDSDLQKTTADCPVTVDPNQTKYFYCKITNENTDIDPDPRYGIQSNFIYTNVVAVTSVAIVEESLGSQSNPVATWEELKTIIHGDELKSPIYISGTMEANETITVANGTVELISVGSTTITRTSNFLDAFFESADALTFTGSVDTPIIFAGNNIEATSPMIAAEADLTMTYCTMQNNVNTSNSGGGAILVKSGTVTLDNCIFTGNKTTGGSSPGGAIYMTTQETNKLIATNTTFQSNTAKGMYGNGGAISFENNKETNILNNCSFISNSASDTGRGGGIYVYTGAKVVLNGISMSGNTIASSDTSQTQPTQEDIYMNNAPHLTLAGQLTIPTISWNRGGDSYTKVFTSGYDSVAFAETSSIGVTISGTIPTGSLQVFVDNTALSPGQMNCISVTAEGYQCSWDTDGYGRVTFVSN